MNTTPKPAVDAPFDGGVRPAWVDCESRGPWLRNGLEAKIDELRLSARRARKAFRKDFMGEPANYFADACDEAADALQHRLDAVRA